VRSRRSSRSRRREAGAASRIRTFPPGSPERARPRADLKHHALAFAVIALAFFLATQDGGFAPSTYGAAGLFVLALMAIWVDVPRREAVGWSGAFRLAVGALGLFTLWSFASIAWSDVPADAWDGANRTLLYWLTFTVVGVRPWSGRALRAAVLLISGGIAAIALGMLLISAAGGQVTDWFIGGRLTAPTGYANATAALFVMALWPAVYAATAPALPVLVRSLGLGAACLLLELAVLTQSRGGAIALAATALAFVAMAPSRWRAVAALSVVAALTALSWDRLVAVRLSRDEADLLARLEDARMAIGASALVAIVLVAVAVTACRRFGPAERAGARLSRAADRAVAALAVLGSVAVVVWLAANPGWMEARWDDFKASGDTLVEQGQTRFSGTLGSNRYDFYRVALDVFEDNPLVGIGADNFAVPYLIARRTPEAPLYPHSLALRIASQLGLVGIALFLAFLAGVAAGFLRGRRRLDSAGRAALAATAAGGLFWLVHGMGDWLWEMPAVTLVGMTLLAMGAHADDSPPVAAVESARPRGWSRPVSLLLIIALALTLAVPWLSSRYEASALTGDRRSPIGAVADLGRAADLNPLSADPLIPQAILARELGRPAFARGALDEAIRREPKNWFAHYELALLEAVGAQRADALRQLDRVERLNPQQPVVARLRIAIGRGDAIVASSYERELVGQLDLKLRPTAR
jgi:hypothetical protein